jgi:hypothetical protein
LNSHSRIKSTVHLISINIFLNPSLFMVGSFCFQHTIVWKNASSDLPPIGFSRVFNRIQIGSCHLPLYRFTAYIDF